MFFFRRKKEDTITDLSWLGTDLHAHLLPGIDDGVQDMDTSVTMIEGLRALGFKKLVATPHVLWEMYPNTPEIIYEKKEAVKTALRNAGIEMTFSAAAEYFIDEHFVQALNDKQPLLTIQDNIVLVEFSMINAPFDLQDVLFQMQLQGYRPLIAHPERYIYLTNRKSFFETLKAGGCFFQLNLLSIAGHYGSSVQALAGHLLKEKMYDYAGTDLHGERHLHALQGLAASPLYRQLQESEQLKNHLL